MGLLLVVVVVISMSLSFCSMSSSFWSRHSKQSTKLSATCARLLVVGCSSLAAHLLQLLGCLSSVASPLLLVVGCLRACHWLLIFSCYSDAGPLLLVLCCWLSAACSFCCCISPLPLLLHPRRMSMDCIAKNCIHFDTMSPTSLFFHSHFHCRLSRLVTSSS